jgi:hypothetical protein
MRIFGRKLKLGKKRYPHTDQQPVHGGDGLSADNPAIVNCASMGVAHHLIEQFISASCGSDWNKEMEMTVKNPNDAETPLTMVSVKTADGSDVSFYFDLTRPVGGTASLLGLRQKP